MATAHMGSYNEDVEYRIIEFDPLLELASEIVLACDAIDEHRGAFCTACKCNLQYHLSCEDGVCELCECDSIYWLCTSCGNSRAIEAFPVGKDGQTRVCKFCIAYSPVKIKQRENVRQINAERAEFLFDREPSRNRSEEARMVLRELTE